MTLIGDAKIIIMDEPTGNLDLKSRDQILSLIKDLVKYQEDRAIIVSTQHIEEADIIANKICIIKKGLNLKYDTPANIKNHFGNGFRIKISSSAGDFKNNFLLNE
jgi:ATP-binding cassette subfamily A (ABC1) protein 3